MLQFPFIVLWLMCTYKVNSKHIFTYKKFAVKPCGVQFTIHSNKLHLNFYFVTYLFIIRRNI